ncbi:hypothetical protein BH09PSE6_BH09PSE6_27790 [soil metagenome]
MLLAGPGFDAVGAGVVGAGVPGVGAAGAGRDVTTGTESPACSGGTAAQAASRHGKPMIASRTRGNFFMIWLLVEALGAAALILFLVWWTMKPPRQ